MCPPDHFTVAYEINPFMHAEVAVDQERAAEEWHGLRRAIEEAGAKVETMDAVPGLPDIVFTANAGLVLEGVAVPSHFLHPERRSEEPWDRAWFSKHGLEVRDLAGDQTFEGAGDAMLAGPDGVLLAGYRWRTSVDSHSALSKVLHRPVRSLALADPFFFHLDLALLPLGTDRALAVGPAFDSHAATVMSRTIPLVEELSLEEGLAFCANSVVVGRSVIMDQCPARVGRMLECWGYEPAEAPVSEFRKAGGSCRCLTLAL
jgi:N-dimethylarginine dimethylaminohydrolase